MPNKTEIRCFKRWLFLSKGNTENDEDSISSEIPHNVSNQWTAEEDSLLRSKVEQFGTTNWVIIARYLPGRLGRQCRERWYNVLDPNIVRKEWTREEDSFILLMHEKIGSKWSQISKMEPLVGRTVSQIKNRFYQNLKGKNLSGIKYPNKRDLKDISKNETAVTSMISLESSNKKFTQESSPVNVK
jgi:hypothetical protein